MTEKATALRDTGHEQSNRELGHYFRKNEAMRDNPYLRTHLAQIKRIEADADGRPTGRATVELLTLPGVRSSVLMPVPSSQYWFVGGLPPINTLVTVGWLPQGLAVILNYYPLGWKKLKDLKALPDLDPGEVFFRAQVRDADGAAAAGATFRLDKDGNVIIQDKTGNTTITMNTDGSVSVVAATVHLGGVAGQELATKAFVENVYDGHTHLPGSFVAPSGGGPVTGNSASPAPTSESTSLTAKTKAE